MHTTGSYKGHATITLSDEGQDPGKGFSFGWNKARLILENLQAIRDFADRNEPKPIKRGRCEDAPCCGCCE